MSILDETSQQLVDLIYRRTKEKISNEYIKSLSIEFEKECHPADFLKEAFKPEDGGYRGFIDFREAYTYSPGETVNGKICLALNKSTYIYNLEFKILGESHILCGSSAGYCDWSHEVFFQHTTNFKDCAPDQVLVTPPGEHTFEFECQLPKDTPSCMVYESYRTNQAAYIIYYGQVSLYIKGENDPVKTSYFLPVQRRLWLADPKLETAVNTPNTKADKERYLLGLGGSIEVQVKVQQGLLLTAGHDLLIDVYIDNKSRHIIDMVTCTLYQVAKFHHSGNELYKIQRKLAMVRLPIEISKNQQEKIKSIRIHTDPSLEPAVSRTMSPNAARQVILGYTIGVEVGVNSFFGYNVFTQVPMVLCSPTQDDITDWESSKADRNKPQSETPSGGIEEKYSQLESDGDQDRVKSATEILMEPFIGALVYGEMRLKRIQEQQQLLQEKNENVQT